MQYYFNNLHNHSKCNTMCNVIENQKNTKIIMYYNKLFE